MGVKLRAKKRQGPRRRRRQLEDKLSSLPDDILIAIISRLPLYLAIVTESLSKRWRGLWKNIDSIHITPPTWNKKFRKCLDLLKSVKQITSPSIHSFSVDFQSFSDRTGVDSLLAQICNRNVRRLMIKTYRNRVVLPSIFCQEQSLVSFEVCSSSIDWEGDLIYFPNLKSLIFNDLIDFDQRYNRLIQACPSLEELSLEVNPYRVSEYAIECSNQNLRRLSIKLCGEWDPKVVINAPKLEYLAVRASRFVSFCFDEEPVVLREANIDIEKSDHLSDDQIKSMSKFICAFRNVRVLTMDANLLDKTSANFPNAIQLTIRMKKDPTLRSLLLSYLDRCPLLEAVTLKLWAYGRNDEQFVYSKPSEMRTLRQKLKRLR